MVEVVDKDSVPPYLEIECGVCYELLFQPYLTDCCGHHFCMRCFDKISSENQPCPMCKALNFKCIINKNHARLINDLTVYCTYRSRSCQWQGKVKQLSNHQKKGERLGECQYVDVQCINKCGVRVERHLMKKHEDEMCSKRPLTNSMDLSRCIEGLVVQNEDLRQTVDRLSKLNSINTQSISNLTQQLNTCCTEIGELKGKLHEIGLLPSGVECWVPPTSNHTSSGCISPYPTVPAAATISNKSLAISTPSTEVTLRIVPYQFTLDHYEKRFLQRLDNNAAGRMWMSRPFYTHTGGYKMCVRVSLTAALEINDECHHEQTVTFNDKTPHHYTARVTQGDRSTHGWGKTQFINRVELAYDPAREVQYLKDDKLVFRVDSVIL